MFEEQESRFDNTETYFYWLKTNNDGLSCPALRLRNRIALLYPIWAVALLGDIHAWLKELKSHRGHVVSYIISVTV